MKFQFHIVCMMAVVQATVFASMDVSRKMQLQELLERRLNPVVQSVDLEAKVYVSLDEEETDTFSPAIPYALQKYATPNRQSFSKVNVVVMARIKELPAPTKNMIRKLMRDVGAPVSITLESMNALPKSEFSEREPASVKILGLETFKQMFSSVSDLFMALMGLISFAAFVGAILLFKAKNNDDSSSELALQSPASELNGYHVDSWTAILSDCYWCEEDSYAAFLWQRIPVEQRKEVVSATTFLSNYIENVMHLEGTDRDHLKHPYYLNPMSVNHLDNKTLTEMVRKHPSLFNRLSLMRRNSLKLTALERVKAEQEAALKATAPDLMRLPADQERRFQVERLIPLASVAEEEDILKLKGLSLEIKARIPSLQWLCELSVENRRDILDSMTIRELACAWVGPKGVLETLALSLPKHRKLELQGYLSEVSPSRESEAFKKLHSMSIEAMKSESKKNHGTQVKKVA